MIHQPLATTVKGLDILLLKGLSGNVSHVGLPHGTADCSSIVAVILLMLGERLDVLWGHDADPMPYGLEPALPIEGASASF